VLCSTLDVYYRESRLKIKCFHYIDAGNSFCLSYLSKEDSKEMEANTHSKTCTKRILNQALGYGFGEHVNEVSEYGEKT
jgi:hypothetical protein